MVSLVSLVSLSGLERRKCQILPLYKGRAEQTHQTHQTHHRTRVGLQSSEHILWVADNTKVPTGNTLIVYRADELKQLVGLSPDEIRHLHAVKKELDGELLDVDDDEGDRIILATDLLAHNNTTCHACGQDNGWDNNGRPICAVCHPPPTGL